MGKAQKTATLIFNKMITATVFNHLCDSHCVVVEVRTSIGTIVLVNQYYQFEDPIQQHLQKTESVFRTLATMPIVMMVDLNAWSTLWGSPTTNTKGEEVQLLMQELGLEVENTQGGPPTVEGRAGVGSYVDATITNGLAQGRVGSWKVTQSLTVSDHNFISFLIGDGADNTEPTRWQKPKYNIRKANWDQLRGALKLPPVIREGEDVNKHAKDVMAVIKKAMNKAIPKTRPPAVARTGFWTQELTNLRTRVRQQKEVSEICR